MSECFDLVYHGGGGFSWSEVWNMPIPHRRFNIKKIQQYLDAVEQARNNSQNKVTENTDMSKFKIPDEVVKASEDRAYVTKAKSKTKK
jgi:hypothetical protein